IFTKISSRAIVGVGTLVNINCPPYSSDLAALMSAPTWSRVTACPVRELRERAAELAFQASDVGAIADALEPLQHQRHVLAVLPDRFDWRLRERDRRTHTLP